MSTRFVYQGFSFVSLLLILSLLLLAGSSPMQASAGPTSATLTVNVLPDAIRLDFATTLANTPSAGNLIAYYPFNGNANDESGNGNHGTANGATITEDRFGNLDSAYRFDGVDDYLDNVRFAAFPGMQYVIRTHDLSGGADTVLTLYDTDAVTVLASNDDTGSDPAAELTWTAPYTGTYFVEVTSAPSGVTDCTARYRLSITTTASLAMTITRAPDGATLTWPHDPQYAGYQVRRSTMPYFTAGDWSELLANVPAPSSDNTVSYTDASAFNSATTSYFYAILPTDADGRPYLVSNRVAAFNFALTPGSN